MANFPSRCHHIKVNGTQCGSPALRRHTLCYFHQRHHDQCIALNAERLKNARAGRRNLAINLPVLEDANAIQVSLMQIMRLIIAGQIDHKTAGLLLYGLQTASANLARTNFNPYAKDMVLDPDTVQQTPLNGHIWDDSDFDGIADDEDEEEAEPEQKKAKAMRPPNESSRKNKEAEATRVEHKIPQPAASPAQLPPKRPSANVDMNEVRTKITNQIRQSLPDLAVALAHKANGKSAG
jgi:hypothetical protein